MDDEAARLGREFQELFRARSEDVKKFREALTPESDRGCALMAAAYLDARLTDLLRANFVIDDEGADKLLRPDGPIGSFSSRIDLAYLLGLLGGQARADLHLIRKIRNEFGHNANPMTFENKGMADRCKALQLHLHDPSVGARRLFTQTVMGLLAVIDAKVHVSTHAVWDGKVFTDEDRTRLRNMIKKPDADDGKSGILPSQLS